MKNTDEIISNPRLIVGIIGNDGGNGLVSMPLWKGSVIWSNGAGWEHVSVSPESKRITPSWDDMCRIKDMFFYEAEAVIQIHPPKAEYVNNMPNCLHLWRCTYKDMVLPPSVLVGVRKGQTQAEFIEELEEAYKIAGEEY